MKVSFLVIAHNEQRYISKTLKSIERQRYSDLDILVVSDGSTDQTAHIVKKQFPHVRLIEHTTNRGISAARNTAIRAARGKICFIIDAHITINPDATKIAVDLFNKNPKLGAVCGYYKSAYHKNDLNRISDLKRMLIFGKMYKPFQITLNNWTTFSGGFAAYRKEILQLKFPTDFNGYATEDVFWAFNIIHNQEWELWYDPRIRGLHWQQYTKHRDFLKKNIIPRAKGVCLFYIKAVHSEKNIPYKQFFCSFPVPVLSFIQEISTLLKILTTKTTHSFVEKIWLCFYLMIYEYLKIIYLVLVIKKTSCYTKINIQRLINQILLWLKVGIKKCFIR